MVSRQLKKSDCRWVPGERPQAAHPKAWRFSPLSTDDFLQRYMDTLEHMQKLDAKHAKIGMHVNKEISEMLKQMDKFWQTSVKDASGPDKSAEKAASGKETPQYQDKAKPAKMPKEKYAQMKHPAEKSKATEMTANEKAVPDLQVTVHNTSGPVSETTIPGNSLRFASKFMPGQVSSALGRAGISVHGLSKLASRTDVGGAVFEHEDGASGEKVVIAFGKTPNQENNALDIVNLKIRVFKIADSTPVSTTTIPSTVAPFVAPESLLPSSVKYALKAGHVSWEDVAKFASENQTKGVTLLRHDDLETGDGVTLSLE